MVAYFFSAGAGGAGFVGAAGFSFFVPEPLGVAVVAAPLVGGAAASPAAGAGAGAGAGPSANAGIESRANNESAVRFMGGSPSLRVGEAFDAASRRRFSRRKL